MNADNTLRPEPRSLDVIFKDHLDNTMACGQTLSQLFLNLDEPEPYIAKVKQLEEHGDAITAEAYHALELLPYSEFIHLTEQFVNRLDDVVDGINDTARLIDICVPRRIEAAAQEILAALLSMIAKLQSEIAAYPENEVASVKACREALKGLEVNADIIYHEWRKTQRRVNALPLVDESNWTEILGVLEETTDAAYHAVLLLERMAKYRLRQ
jgi:uncharacterized protein Yka (UPF0111/DUF47 family)